MEQKKLSNWLKAVIIIVALCALVVYAGVVPLLGQEIVGQNPEFRYCYAPWLCFVELTAVPCFAALVLGWRIVCNIGKDRSFSVENASMLKTVSMLALGDAIFFFVGNIVYLFMNMNHPGIVLFSLVPVCIGVAIAVTAAGLSHIVKKAADLQEQSDLTI